MSHYINIRCNCQKIRKLAKPLILLSTLVALSPHALSQNLVTNPGFESGTSGWTLEDDASAQYTQSDGRSGDRLTHWSSSTSYRAETKQTVSGLSAGTYRLSTYTVGGNTSGAWLWAYCDGQGYSTPIPSSPWGSWTQVVVDDIEVSGNSCQVGITTEDSEWSSFDDVVFERVSDGGGPSTIVIEEGAGLCGVDGSVDSNHSGFNGSGFANTDNATGNGVDWTINVPSSGNYTLEWRYANGGSTNRPGDVLINGSSQAMVDFPSTSSWTSWTSASASVALNAGENTIRLQATTSPGMGNIDSLSVTGDSPQAVNCSGNPDDDDIFLPGYILGADWGWVQEHESIGWTYSDNGQTKSLERILADHGFNYARFRLFVCPDCPGGYNSAGPEPGVLWSGASDDEAWHDVEHNIQMAKRAKACGMGIFMTFHLSDTWASIGKQYRPSEWEGMSLSQMRTASYNHTKNALDQMVAEGVKPDMIQCGNEINTHVSGYSFNEWDGYSGIINSCAQAVRDTDPDILLVAHHGRPRPDGNFAQWIDKLFVDSNPTIEADVICGSTYGTTNNGGDWWDMFTYATNVTGKPVMSCEYTDKRRELVNDTFRSLPNSLGTFIWEPTAYGDSKPFWLDETSNGTVARTNANMDEYARIAREEGLPVPLTPASQLEGTSCQ